MASEKIRETASCPSAVCAVNDYVAIHLMRAAAAEGIAIPNELSLTGFDNIELAAELPIPLTTVEQDFFSIGYRAAEHLIDQIEGKHAPSGEIITLPTRLIPRKSARPPA